MTRSKILLCLPSFIKKWGLCRLFRITAAAFGCQMPPLQNLTYAGCLDEYARITREAAEKCMANGGQYRETRQRLHERAFTIGRNLRIMLLVRTWPESLEVLQAVYRLLGIDFLVSGETCFMIRRCHFSRQYSQDVCQLVSALDEGLAAGLCGGKLRFQERITAGSSCCRGTICREERR